MKKEFLEEVAEILGNGYKCYLNLDTHEVSSAEDVSLEIRQSGNFREYVPLEGEEMFRIMQAYCSDVNDFEKQSELMECLIYEQPFQNFKRKVYALHIADEWLVYRKEAIVKILKERG